MKVLHSVCQQIWKTQQWALDWKRSVSFQSQRKAMPKNAQTTTQIALISHASKVTLKILQARLQQYVNCEFPSVQAGFRKHRETRNQIVNVCWIREEAAAAAAAAKSLQSCPTLCDPIDGSLPGCPVSGILQARALKWVAISSSNA